MATAEEIKQGIANKKVEVESGNPEVEKTRIKVDAVKLLADNKNPVFSELERSAMRDETFEYNATAVYAIAPLKGLERRLKAKGIKQKITVIDEKGNAIEKEAEVQIRIDFLLEFLKELLEVRHCANRGRVNEYIRALEAANRSEIIERDNRPQGRLAQMMNRLG